MKVKKFNEMIGMAKAVNVLSKTRDGKDDRKFVLENKEKSEKEFLEFIGDFDAGHDEKAEREGIKISKQLEKVEPHYLTDDRGKKKRNSIQQNFSLTSNFGEIKVSARTKNSLVPDTKNLKSQTQALIANHSDLSNARRLVEGIVEMNIVEETRSKNKANYLFISSVISCVKAIHQNKINIVLVRSYQLL